MSGITSGVGLISGFPIADTVEQLLAIEARPKQLIERQNAVLGSQQIAFQDINAKLLALKMAAAGFTSSTSFSATTSSSSNESILTVSSGSSAIPGNYALTVQRLVAAQQSITRGFQDTDASAMGAGTLTFERGEARLESQTLLSTLNGGEGMQRGKIRITDRSGASTIVDLSTAVTVDDVLDQINGALGVSVHASVDGDRLKITDTTGQTTSNLVVADVGLTTTASSLGLAGSSNTNELTGTQINTVGESSMLSLLNDGNGVGIRDGATDFQIASSAGNTFNIDLSGAVTLGDVIDTINETTAGEVVAAVAADGVSLQLTDTTGGGTGFSVTAMSGSTAAADLGLVGADTDGDGNIVGSRLVASINSKLLKYLNGGQGLAGAPAMVSELTAGTALDDLFNGSGLTTSNNNLYEMRVTARDGTQHHFNFDLATTAQDLMDLVSTTSGGKLSLTIENNSFRLTDNTGGAGNLKVEQLAGNAVTELGLALDAPQDSVLSVDTNPVPQLSGQTGLGTIRITNRNGAATDIDLSGAHSVSDILAAINDANAGVTAKLNQAGNGLLLTDTTGGSGDMVISDVSGATATNLNLVGTYSDDTVDSGNLQFQYITEATRIETLGVSRGKFRITDSSGASASVDLTQGNEVTIGDVIREINSRGLAINARINDTGDGILIEDTGPGAVAMKIEEEGSTTAADLGLLGEAATAGENIDGTFEKTVTIEATDKLSDVVKKINEAKVGVTASIINDGSGAAPYRLILSSEKAGTDGAFVFDDGGLGFGASTLSQAQDAVVFFGSSDPAKALVITSKSNTLENVVPGTTINLLATSQSPVQVTVSEDKEKVVESVKSFVTKFNELVDTLNKYDSYDSETQERGLLLGDSTVSTVRRAIYSAVNNRNPDLTGQYNSLSQIGIRIGSGAKLEFDENKFRQALNNDPDAVEELFTFKQTEEDADGEEQVIASGIGVKIEALLKRLTDAESGAVQARVDTIDQQIQANKDRIEDLNEALEAKRERLTQQFVAMETALAQMQQQSQALASFQPISFNSGNKSSSGLFG